jgi:xanthine dehydrogenase YagR molybdenum-binding subunit
MLHAVLLTSPHAHAKIKSIDVTEAKASKGVKAIRLIAQPGQELQWAGAEIAAVAATTEEQARDAVRKIKVDYEVLPHVVREEDLSKVGKRAKPSGERIEGDPDEAWQKAEVKVEGRYGAPVITHCCLEPHGQVSAWRGDKIDYWPSTQNVSGVGPDLARSLNVPAANITVAMDHIGGGFGAKFPSDLWGAEGTQLSKEAGGMPVKLFLDRAQELINGGVRPSFFANIKIGGTKDGKITAWQSESWATGGFGGGGAGPLPYVFRIPNMRAQHSAVSINAGSARAWRAPNHPQVSFLTCSAIEDFAAKIGMDPLGGSIRRTPT